MKGLGSNPQSHLNQQQGGSNMLAGTGQQLVKSRNNPHLVDLHNYSARQLNVASNRRVYDVSESIEFC